MRRSAPCLLSLFLFGLVQGQIPINLNDTIHATLAEGQTICYQMTTNDVDTRHFANQFQAPRLFLRLEPCLGDPHMTVSVYGCPSQGNPIVFEYMSAQQVRNTVARRRAGGSSTPIQEWEWVGDIETLTLEYTHRTWYFEIEHKWGSEHANKLGDASFTFSTRAFDINGTSLSTKEELFPLGYPNKTAWDRKLVRGNSSSQSTFGGGDVSLNFQFHPPPGSTKTNHLFEYAIFVMEVTDNLGKTDGHFWEDVNAMCCPERVNSAGVRLPCEDDCQTKTGCPRDFMLDCSENTLTLATLKANQTEKVNEFFKMGKKDNGVYWNSWTYCGLKQNAHKTDADAAIIKLDQYVTHAQPEGVAASPVWFSPNTKDSKIVWHESGRLELDVSGFAQDNSNVFLINVAVRRQGDADPSQYGAYETMSLQLKTPRYEAVELSSSDHNVLIGVGCGLVFCVLVFAIAAIVVARRRRSQLAARIRQQQDNKVGNTKEGME